MAKVKILKDYKPAEGWKPGEIVDITDPWQLIREGKVVLVDDNGVEIEHHDIVFQIQKSLSSNEAMSLIEQLIEKHPGKKLILEALKGATEKSEEPNAFSDVDASEEELQEEEIAEKVKIIKRKQAIKELMAKDKK